jgi:acetyl-CoA carboxylase carboxyltransferase component
MTEKTKPQSTPQSVLESALAETTDKVRTEAAARRHQRGGRTARENLADLIDTQTLIEYGQLAVAAQRSRRLASDIRIDTAADGVITGIGQVRREAPSANAETIAVIINDYSVLAGTQGYYHHQKIDRILTVAARKKLPVVMFTEGGGGRPGDTDADAVVMAGLNSPTFHRWAAMAGRVPRIAINHGFCFAGNAALFGAADIRIATQDSYIGMAGPAMIEGGGLGHYHPTEIGPASRQSQNGVIDILVADESEATAVAKKLLSLVSGSHPHLSSSDQNTLDNALPENRRVAFDPRSIIHTLVDDESFIESRPLYGRALVTGFASIAGHAIALLASDCRHSGGAIDAEAAQKVIDFLKVVRRWRLPVVSLIDTPGFMVGPDSEGQGAVRIMSELFTEAAAVTTPWIAVFLRRGYGLGAMALAGGSFAVPILSVSWPQGEFGGMGLEGAVKLGFRKELEAVEGDERDALFQQYVDALYAKGRATEAASYLEVDAVIKPAETRDIIASCLRQATEVSSTS